jgi:hypothetical protein
MSKQTKSERQARVNSPSRPGWKEHLGLTPPERGWEVQYPRGRYSEDELRQFVEAFRRDGFCILPGHIPAETIEVWREAFLPILRERIHNGTASARGPNRYYISLPFTPPFADPAVYEDPDILAILEAMAGPDIVMPELATDTPLQGSDYQVIHRDHLQLSPEMPEADPARPFQFGVNFSLVDVTRENGPFEVVRGTHLLSDEEARRMVQSGEAEARIEPLLMKAGDVMIRDVRALHRGTPNHTETPRPMVVAGYNHVRHRRPQLRIFIPRDAQLSERGQQLMRLNPVVKSLAEAVETESYSNLYFLEEE